MTAEEKTLRWIAQHPIGREAEGVKNSPVRSMFVLAARAAVQGRVTEQVARETG